MLLQDRREQEEFRKECEEDKVRIKMGKSSWESTGGACLEEPQMPPRFSVTVNT